MDTWVQGPTQGGEQDALVHLVQGTSPGVRWGADSYTSFPCADVVDKSLLDEVTGCLVRWLSS